MRINRYLSAHGYCSRRAADELIASGRVLVNGKRAEIGQDIQQEDKVVVEGRRIHVRERALTIAFHKPIGYITTMDTRKADHIFSLLPKSPRLFPIGRLDVATSGLILLTNDGVLANRLMHPRYEHEKEYLVTTEYELSDSDLERLRRGIRLEDGMTLPATVVRRAPCVISLTIREGRNRQIRRMMIAIGTKVLALQRVRIGSIKLGDLPIGSWRAVTDAECRILDSSNDKGVERKKRKP